MWVILNRNEHHKAWVTEMYKYLQQNIEQTKGRYLRNRNKIKKKENVETGNWPIHNSTSKRKRRLTALAMTAQLNVKKENRVSVSTMKSFQTFWAVERKPVLLAENKDKRAPMVDIIVSIVNSNVINSTELLSNRLTLRS